MVLTNHILVDDEVKEKLMNLKIYPREIYNDVLRRLLKLNKQKKNGK